MQKGRFFIFLVFSFLLQSFLFAQVKPRVAVMPFQAGSGISKPEAQYLTDLIRTDLIKTQKFEIISNDQLNQMMKAKQAKQGLGSGSCSSEKCIIDLGNALECEKMIVGQAAGAFGEFTISVKMLDVVKQKYDIAERVTIKNKNKFPDAARQIVTLLTGGQVDLTLSAEKEKERLEKEKEERKRLEKEKLEKEQEAKERIAKKKLKKEREQIIALNREQGVNYTGMLWRSVIVPGWGHYYSNQKRGYVYAGLWAGIGSAFLWSHINYNSKNDAYQSSKEPSQFDSLYDETNSAFKMRGYLSFAFIGVYLAVISDIALSGKRYILSSDSHASARLQFNIYTGAYQNPILYPGINTYSNPLKDDSWNFIVSWRY